jgi:2-polyprenyl-3-methyl-5-hydroxy-6-metoxy-1,4-benzoquinol methylase
MHMPRKIKGKEYGLEFGLIVFNFLFKSKALHYGYWRETDEVGVWNFGKAQENYTNNLLNHIPKDVTDVLDVGCGTGIVAQRLIQRGCNVECLSPSPFLNSEARKMLPDSTKIHETTFEEFKTDKTYDLILFVESFQYVKLEESLAKCLKLLRPGGRILICDVFRLDTPGKSPIGGGHYYRDYLKARELCGLVCVKDIDITANIAPTFDVIQDVSQNLLKPSWDNFLRIVESNHPIAGKFMLWKFKKKLQKVHKHFDPRRNGKSFLEYKTYRIQILTGPATA